MSKPQKVKEFSMIRPISPESPLILASSSPYRAELLSRLRLPFTGIAPDIDETVDAGETAQTLTGRLALAKARALCKRHPGRWVLGSDQAAAVDGLILGKPGNHERAVQQLSFLSGKSVQFLTAVALVNGERVHRAMDLTTARFRQLSLAQIEHYLAQEPAYDCAGSFKCEGLGIALFEEIQSNDPTGLIGLPLIAVRHLLAEAGYDLP